MEYDELVALASRAFGPAERGDFRLELIMAIVPDICDGCAIELFGYALPPDQAAIWSPFQKIIQNLEPVALGMESEYNAGAGGLEATLAPPRGGAFAGDVSAEEAAILERIGVRSAIGLPLRFNGHLAGSLSVFMASSGRTFTSADFAGFIRIAERLEGSISDGWLTGTRPVKVARGEDLSLLARKFSFGRLERYAAERELAERRRQQAITSEMAGRFITGGDLQEVFHEVAGRVADGLRVPYVKIAQFMAGEGGLVVRAVQGFSEDLVDTFRIPAGSGSQAGFALETESTIRSSDFALETRFEVPDVPGYPLRSGLAVVVGGVDQPWGVIEADSTGPREYTDNEAGFLKTMAGMLGQAIERNAAEVHRQGLADQLAESQKMEGLGRLAGGVAHDFNNILTSIQGFADLHLMDPASVGAMRDYALEIRKATDRAARLTAQLLAFSRRQALLSQVFDLRQLVIGLVPNLRRMVGDHIEVGLDLQEHSAHILADPLQIEQVILNLAANAADAMPTGGSLTISLRARRTPGGQEDPGPAGNREAVIVVSDTGTGISPGVRTRIFDPFFTTKAPGKGAGLGLATVYGIVQQSGGRIEVGRSPAGGASFTIHLPGLREDEGGPPVPERIVHANPPADGSAGTILVAEDDSSVRELLTRLLPRMGYRVLVARDGAEALATAKSHTGRLDLVLSDVIMPVMGGAQLAEALGRDHPDLPILFMSGYADDELAGQDILHGSVPVLQKPFTIEELLERLDGALRTR